MAIFVCCTDDLVKTGKLKKKEKTGGKNFFLKDFYISSSVLITANQPCTKPQKIAKIS